MDFIDDFIEEYKSNPCLWKADSVDFRNRTRRQEAYMRLIAVATRHGELYNVERTKQKINNLRCAFRHQLRKYNEVKKKGEKYEPYCPKRRYFESLMFLKDEEIPEKKSKQTDNLPLQQNTDNTVVQQEAYEEFSDAESLPKQMKNNDNNKLSPSTSANEFCANLFEEVEVDPIISIQSVNSSSNNNNQNQTSSGSTTIKDTDGILPTSDNSTISDRRKSVNTSITSTLNDKVSNSTADHISELNRDKQITTRHKYIKSNRKRSLSGSSQLSDTEAPPTGKCRAGISNIDFERLFQLAFKNADNQLDDHFTNFGKIIAHKLRSMDNAQAIYAEKIIADVLYQGQMKMLSTLSITQFLSVDNTTVYVESHTK
ncbi:striatin homolog [Drosophila innubila]|uniref:striatin homolog n=1 Tax=Drosophila innubila TaxID=198719 RepID=UPI00148C84E8|nr:striatin homolog [Drosophila innubila]